MKQYLATTAISEMWDSSDQLFLLGPWCLKDKRNNHSLKEKQYSLIPTPWSSARKIYEASNHCYGIYERLLSKLYTVLNRYHQASYPLEYWRIVIGPWLLCFVNVLYERYLRIDTAVKLLPNLTTSVIPVNKCNLRCFDMYDFIFHVQDDDFYNLKLFSIIARNLMPENIIENDTELKQEVFVWRYSWKRKFFFWLLKQTEFFLKGNVALSEMYHLGPWDSILLKLKTLPHPVRLPDFSPPDRRRLKEDQPFVNRETLNLELPSDKFENFLYKIVPSALPLCYVENYKFYKDSIAKIEPAPVVGSAIGWYFNERFKLYCAQSLINGSQVIDFQHGGGYGFFLPIPHERISFEKDVFYTWGWRLGNEEKGMSKPLPNPHLSKIKDTYCPRHNKLLFISTTTARFQSYLHTLLMPEGMFKYHNDKKLFFDHLRKEIKQRVLYRLYPKEYDWQESELIKESYPEFKFITKGALTAWMKKVKLVVIDHPHTAFIEVLNIGVPSIFYWDPDVYLIREDAQRYLDLLIEAGIVYMEPGGAAKKVNEVFSDPISWWLEEEVQNARLQFCQHYGYSSKDWLTIWADEIRLLESGKS